MSAGRPRHIDAAQRVSELAARVGAFWGAGLRVALEGDRPSFVWSEIRIPRSEAQAASDDSLLCLLAHEWGHRCIAPRTVEQGIWWQIVARLEGIRASADAVNVACDLLVDRWYLDHRDWGERYRRTELERILHLTSAPFVREGMQTNSQASFLLACYEQIGGWQSELGGLTLSRDLAAAALVPLFDATRTLEERVRGFLSASAPAWRTSEFVLGALDVGQQAGAGDEALQPILGSPQPWIVPRWDAAALVRLLAARSGTVSPRVLEDVCGVPAAREILGDLRTLESLVRVQSSVDRFVASRRGRRAEGSTAWRLGDPTNELDALLTLERAGLLVPGITTLRRRRARQPVPSTGLPRLCLVIDNSGSTNGAVLESELDAAVALLEAARRMRVEAGAIVFGSGVHAAIEPTLEHVAIARLFGGLSGQSGGTSLAPALARAAAMLPPSGEPMATVVFTDTYVSDAVEAAKGFRQLVARGPVVVFGADARLDWDLLREVRQLSPGPKLVQYRPGDPLVDEALSILA